MQLCRIVLCVSDLFVYILKQLHYLTEHDTMKMPNTGRSTSTGDFDNHDTTTALALNENIAYNAHKKAVISTIDNQVSTRIGKDTAGPSYMTEYDDIQATLSLRVPRSAQSLASAFDESISTVAINTSENTAYNVHGMIQ